MTNYPYSSPPPPPSPPCNSSTSPVLLAPPPPPHPPPACTCNKATPTPPPPSPSSYYSPPFASLSPPPPQPPSSHYSPPPQTPSQTPPVLPLPSPPPPPHFYYSPPVLSPPPPKSNHPSYFPSPPPPSSDYSRPPPPSPLAPSPYHFPRTPHSSPVSPLASPLNHHNSIPPNYYDSSLAPAPGLLPSSNEPRTPILTACVSVGGVFFLAFIVIGLLSTAMKKKVPRLPGRPSMSPGPGQPSRQEFKSEPAQQVQELKSKPAGPEHVIEMGDHDSEVQKVPIPPDHVAGDIVEQAAPQQTNSPNVTDKISSNTEIGKPFDEQSLNDNMDDPQGADEEKLEKNGRRSLGDDTVTNNANASPNVGEGSAKVEEEPNESKKKLRLPKRSKPSSSSEKKGKGKQNYSGALQVFNVASALDLDVPEQVEDGGKDTEQISESEAKDDGSTNVDKTHKSEQPRGDEQEDQTGANNTGSAKDVEGGSNVAGETVEQAAPQQTNSPNVTDKIRSNTEIGKPFDEQSLNDNMDDPPGADEEKLEKNGRRSLGDDTVTNNANASPNVGEGSAEVEEEPNESKKKLRLPKKSKPSSSSEKKGKGKQNYSGALQVFNAASALDLDVPEQAEDEGNDTEQISESEAKDDGSTNVDKSEQPRRDEQEDQTGANNTGSAQEVEGGSNATGEDSNESKRKRNLPTNKSSSRRSSRAKEGKGKCPKVGQILNVVQTFDVGDVDQSLSGDNNEEQVSEAEDDSKDVLSEGSNNAEDAVGKPTAEVQEDPEDGKLPSHQTDTNNTDSAQDVNQGSDAIGEDKKKFSQSQNKSSNSGAKKGKGKSSGVRQILNFAQTVNPRNAEQSQDGDNDAEQVSQSEAQDDDDDDNDEDLVHGGSNDAEDMEEKPTEDELEEDQGDNEPLSRQIEAKKMDSARDVNDAIGKKSGDSKNKLCIPEKNKNPRNGSKKRMDSRIRQGITAGDTSGLNDAKQSQDDGNNEDQVTELEGEEDDGELLSSDLNNPEEIEDQPTADEQEPHQAGTNNADSSQNFEEGSNAVREETNDSKKKLRLPKDIQYLSSGATKRNDQSSSRRGAKKGEIQSRTPGPRGVEKSQDDLNDEEQYEVITQDDKEPYESEPRIDGEELTAGDSNTVDDERELDEPLSHQSERKNRDYAQLVEEEPEAVKDETSVFKNKLSLPKKEKSLSSSGVRSRKESSSNNSQVLNTGRYFDLVGATQDDNNDAEEVHQLENVDDATSVDYTESVQCQEDENGGGQMQESEFQLQHDDKDLNLGGKASNLGMVSLDDVQGKVEVSGPFASAQGSKQALNIVMVHHGGDYKFDKAKVHELKAGSSKKEYSQERKDRTQVQEAEKLFNHGNTGTAASLCDPSMAMISFDDEDDKVQESEPIVSNVDTFLGQLHATGGGIEQSPNFLQNLSTTNDDDPAEELKRGYGIYKGKKAEVHQLSKDSRMIKGQIMVPRTGTKPRNFDKTVTARIGDNLGKGLVSLGGDQEGGSYKDGTSEDVRASGHTSKEPQQLFNIVRSLAATDEGDPNIELEIFEDDKDQLELEYPNKELSIKETSPVELEPSAEDQSVSVTGEDDPDVLQFLNNEFDEAPDLSNKDARPGKPLSRPRATNLRGKRRS
ncbi:uncharacterized protein LOC126793625 [Argentina anserina]|uniref:uncharacterized protein LOC126793625 n=1 Tax=Argentina anserina TaxID=57926 RepID=UPI0021763DF5|nr:uncharacterized protein LOC126793625 [Potentilla anserina]